MIFLPKFWIGVDQDGWDALARATKLERGTFYCLLLMMLVLLLVVDDARAVAVVDDARAVAVAVVSGPHPCMGHSRASINRNIQIISRPMLLSLSLYTVAL